MNAPASFAKGEKKPRLNENETAVLKVLAEGHSWDFGYFSFAPLMRKTSLDRKAVRRACRSLARKGLAEYCRGLWNEDGEVAGAGYAATKLGCEAINKP